MREYPKPFMRLTELKKMGLPEELLLRAYGDRKQTFALKLSPTKKNSPIIFDTAGLDAWIDREIRAGVLGMMRG